MIRTLLFILSLLCAVVTQAQVVQRGYVKEYRGEKAKTALANVEVAVSRAGKTATTADGSFALKFNTAKPGARVSVLRIEKDGYEIFNREALEQWNLNPDEPFVIVMCRSDEFRRLRDRYSEVSSQSYARQKQRDEEALRRKLKDGKLKEDEFRAQLEELRNEYEKKLDNIEEYADRFARIDLSTLSDVKQKIIAMVERGDLDSAIAVYEQQNYLEQYAEAAATHTALANAERRVRQARDSMMQAIHRQADTYRMAGGADNYRKLAALLKGVADADTTNFEAVLEYAVASQEELNNFESMKYLDIASRQPTDNHLLKAFLYRELSTTTGKEEYIQAALRALTPVLKEDSLQGLSQLAQLQCDMADYKSRNKYPVEAEQWARMSLYNRERMFRLNPEGVWKVGNMYQQTYQSELAWSQCMLGEALHDQHKIEEGKQYIQAALENMEQVMKREHKLQYQRDYCDMLATAINAYYKTGQEEEGSKYEELLMETKQRMAHENPDGWMSALIREYMWRGDEVAIDSCVNIMTDIYSQLSPDERLEKTDNIYFHVLATSYAQYQLYDIARKYLDRVIELWRNSADTTTECYHRNMVNYLYLSVHNDTQLGDLSDAALARTDTAMYHTLWLMQRDSTFSYDYYGEVLVARMTMFMYRYEYANAAACSKQFFETIERYPQEKFENLKFYKQYFLQNLSDYAARERRADEAVEYFVRSVECEKDSMTTPALAWLADKMAGDWQRPEPPTVDFKPAASSRFVADTPLYLFNTRAGMFLNSGNGWNTQASVDTVGMAFMLRQEKSEVNNKRWWILSAARWNRPLFYNPDSHAFLDLWEQNHGGPDCYLWNIRQQKNGTFTIQVAPTHRNADYEEPLSYAPDEYLGWAKEGIDSQTGEPTDTEVSPRAKRTDGIHWLLLTEEQYQAAIGGQVPTASAEPSDSARLYLYNTQAARFLTSGNGWGTQATIDSVGQPFTMCRESSTVEPGKTGWTLSADEWHRPLFYEGNGHAYLDMADQNRKSPDCHLWNLVLQADGTYTIQILPTCREIFYSFAECTTPGYIKDEYLGYVPYGRNAESGESTFTEVSPRAKASDGIEWLLLTEEQYQAQREQYLKAASRIEEQTKLYQSTIRLYDNVNNLLERCNATPEQRKAIGRKLQSTMSNE